MAIQKTRYTEQFIRHHWDETLSSSVPATTISARIGWGFYREDLDALMELHRAGKHRKKIEDILTDCNFHTECSMWHNGDYRFDL